ncbi:MAG TPA: SBBP repeat-containing protein [Planctomycetota bacterium]|nr:SBBP repeat-containing protein [Planctomycetota bacterium]
MVRATSPPVARAPVIAPLNGFVENSGQWPDEVLFFACDRGIGLTLLPDALVFRPVPDRVTGEWPAPLVLRLPRGLTAEGEGPLPTQHNFLLGSIRVSHARGFERVVYRDVIPGIDLAVHVGSQGFEYDVLAAPGADVGDLVLAVDGADSLSIEGSVLAMQTAAGRVEQRIGSSWDADSSGARTPVAGQFRLLPSTDGALHFGFDVAGHDPARSLVIDPSLVYATYVGGGAQEQLADMAVGADGGVYLTCRSTSPSPTTHGSAQPLLGGATDAWIGELASGGASLLWGTYVGGSDAETPIGVDVDEDGTVVVAGVTSSTDFPTTPGVLEPFNAGVPNNQAFFATRLSADGSTFVWSTYYGGPDNKVLWASALMPSGNVLLAGESDTVNPPATPGAFDTSFDPGDQLIACLSADGSRLVFQTYFKASSISDIAFDADSQIVFCGQILAQDAPLPATPGAFKTVMPPGSNNEAYVAKLDTTGTQLLWATYLGGDEGDDSAIGLAVDAASAVYLDGLTTSDDFPVTPSAFAMALTEPGDGFVTKLLPNGSGLVWSTYLGASAPSGTSLMKDVAVDTAGNAIVVGESNVSGFPTTPDAFQSMLIGPTPASDCHLTKLDAFGESLVYSTWFGGNSTDYLSRVGLDIAQQPYLGCLSSSTNIPVTTGAYDGTYGGGGGDMVVAKFSLPLFPWKVLGGGLKGAADTTSLAGSGALTTGSPARISARGAKPSAAAILVAGLSEIDAPFKGGVLVPAADLLLPVVTNAQGALDLLFTWPSVPPGIDLTTQIWIHDLGAIHDWSASNALQLTAQ